MLADRLANADESNEELADLLAEAVALDEMDAVALVAFFSAAADLNAKYSSVHDNACVTVLQGFVERGEQLGLS